MKKLISICLLILGIFIFFTSCTKEQDVLEISRGEQKSDPSPTVKHDNTRDDDNTEEPVISPGNEKTHELISTPSPSTGSQNRATMVNLSSTCIDGKAKLTIKEYEIQNSYLIVRGIIENNYEKEFTYSPNNVYVLNNDGRKFPLDVFRHLGSDNTKIAPGEKKDFEYYFTDYQESESLTFYITNLIVTLDLKYFNESFQLKFK